MTEEKKKKRLPLPHEIVDEGLKAFEITPPSKVLDNIPKSLNLPTPSEMADTLFQIKEENQKAKKKKNSTKIELSSEVKGFLADFISTSIYSWEKIKTLAMRAGLKGSVIEQFKNKRELARYIVENYTDGELFLKAVYDMSKRGVWDSNQLENLLLNVNPIMAITMGYIYTEKGEILSVKHGDTFEVDVALSFAGEDRGYVEKVANTLQLKGIKFFYDKFEQIDLWGKDLYVHLDEIYRKKARYCVMFLSKHYANKVWTNHERQSALARAFEEQQEYILPVNLDDTEIPGIRPTIGYIDGREVSPEALADMIAVKCSSDKRSKDMIWKKGRDY